MASLQVGVGISGREGRQAVNSADFAISQFRPGVPTVQPGRSQATSAFFFFIEKIGIFDGFSIVIEGTPPKWDGLVVVWCELG